MSDSALRAVLFQRLAVFLPEFGVAASAASESAEFSRDLGMDSLDAVEFCMHVEDELNVEVLDEDAEACLTFGQAVDLAFKALYGREVAA